MATRTFLGGAPAVPQQDEQTIGGTWVAGDTISYTINGKVLTLTVGTTVTLATILDNLIVMLTGTGSFGTGYSSNALGSDVGEFAMLSFVEDGATIVTVTGPADGRPFTLTVGKNSTSGTFVNDDEVVVATGPHHVDNAVNYSGGTLPVDGDTIVLNENTAYSPKYGLSQSSITPAAIYVQPGVPQGITVGLDPVNRDDRSHPFPEYLPTMWALGNSGDATTTEIEIENTTCPMLRFSSGTGRVNLLVRATSTQRSVNPQLPVLYWEGTHASNTVTLFKGDFGSDNSTTAIFIASPAAQSNSNANDPKFWFGGNMTFTTVRVTGGVGNIQNSTTLLEITGGTVTSTAGTHTETNVDGGLFFAEGVETYATLRIGSSGEVRRTDNREGVVTNAIQVYKGAKLFDYHGALNRSGTLSVKLNHCKLADVTLDVGTDRTVAISG